MNLYQHILFFVILTIVFAYSYNKKEGFESLTFCLNQGYPPEFCKRVPVQSCIHNCPVGSFQVKQFNTFPL